MTGFREIADADVESVIALWQACGLTRPWNDPYKDISFARESETSTVLVMERDGRIIASVMAGHDGHRGMLYYVAVDPSQQRQGLGKAAVRAAEEWLGQRGAWKVNLLVRTENAAVKGFYEALGYEVSPVLCMARKIAPA
ncbi:MAG: GNAT family acetyltransferase [Aestuariivirga sp.]|uniref:GNAT family acetyltransferase n=1 Tax=Aestuariivirga sp. TaxID=2650926 RepID=UPI0025C4168F|nr:GNAT family acetyltransferase [Aestuariivirga sp.]MCA3559396.1 GNAT family acetyltransferase [Aestuariivirga sp.]